MEQLKQEPGGQGSEEQGGSEPTGGPEEAKMEVDTPDIPAGEVKEEKMEVEEEQEGDKEKVEKNEKPRVLLSGLENSERKEMSEIVERLGGKVTEVPGECSHLVMARLARTNNFLLCLPTVQHVLSLSWLRDSRAEEKFLPEDNFALEDPEVESRFNFSLSRTLSRTSRDKLFSGKVFYLTPSVLPSMTVLTAIIEASGGR